MFLFNLIMDHPWLLAFVGFPALIAALPGWFAKIEKAALSRMLANGDEADKKLKKAIVLALVVWAEEKYKDPGVGSFKYAAVDALLAHYLPMLTPEQRKNLIEGTLSALDMTARQATGDSQPPA